MDLKRLFIKPTEGAAEPKAPVGASRLGPPPQVAVAHPVSAPPPPTRTPLLGGVQAAPTAKQPVPRAQRAPDERFLAHLDQIMGGATSSGYTELIGQMDVLKEDIPDKARLIRAAIKSVTRTLGISPAQLLSAIEERLRLLDGERVATESQLVEEARDKVAGNKQASEDATRRITTIDSQLARLQSERAEAERSVATAQKAMESVQGEVAEVRERFMSAFNLRSEELTQMLSDLRSNLSQ